MRRYRFHCCQFVAMCLFMGLSGSLAAAPQVSRESWQRVPDIFQALDARPGARIADVGAGDGFFTARLAEAVGPEGRVYAVDISQPTLDRLMQNVRSRSLTNVDAILGTPSDPRLPAGLDAVLIVNAYHEMTEYQLMLAAIRRALKPDGHLVIVEPIVDSQRGTPRDNQANRHQIAPHYVERDAIAAGFVVNRLEYPFSQRPGMNVPEFLLVLTPEPADAPPITTAAHSSFVTGEAMVWQQPDQVIAALNLEPGSIVADLGAGGGAFTRRLAKAVGPTGRAIGLDIDAAAIEAMQADAKTRGLPNYEARLVAADDAGLARGSVNLILVSNTYHMMKDHAEYFQKLRPALRSGGRLVVIDMPPNSFGAGSAPNNFTADAVERTLAEAGYRLIRTHTFLKYQFFLEFTVAGAKERP